MIEEYDQEDSLSRLDKSPPILQYDLSKVPISVARSFESFKQKTLDGEQEEEIVIKKPVPSWHQANPKNNYCRGVKWAPDGSCLMTNSNDHIIRLFNLPPELLQSLPAEEDKETISSIDKDELPAILTIKENSIIYDYVWSPEMDSLVPSTCSLLTSCQNGPIHLWDAYNASLQSTYSIKNQSDELISVNSLAFAGSLSSKILAGCKRSVSIVDVNRPGTHLQAKKPKRSMDRQHGIISCLATNPIDHNLFIAGSYSRQIGIYDIRQALEPQCLLTGQKGGLTHMKFSGDGQLLFSGGRMDPEILCWDMRNLGEVIGVFRRQSYTNQTMYFDISPDDKYIATGDVKGQILIWDVMKNITIGSESGDFINKDKKQEETDNSHVETTADFVFQAHADCANGISFHPYLPLLSSVSGQRHWQISGNKYLDCDQVSDYDEPVEDRTKGLAEKIYTVNDSGSEEKQIEEDPSPDRDLRTTLQISSSNKIENSLQMWRL